MTSPILQYAIYYLIHSILRGYSPLKWLVEKYNCHCCHCIDDENGTDGMHVFDTIIQTLVVFFFKDEKQHLAPTSVQEGQSVCLLLMCILHHHAYRWLVTKSTI